MSVQTAVLLATYNGEAYFREQLQSLAAQTQTGFDLFIRDDASSDATLEILSEMIPLMPFKVIVLPKTSSVGAMKSFGILLKYAMQYGKYDYFMFCDQDDVWFSDKVEKTAQLMTQIFENAEEKKPLLVYTDLQVVDSNLNVLGDSFWQYNHLDPSQNALNYLLMQNVVTGCTMMINRRLAEEALPFPEEAVMHDYWLSLIAKVFGEMHYLNEATIAYRQHGKNVSGGAVKFNFSYVFRKALKFFKAGEFLQVLGRHMLQAAAFYARFSEKLNPEQNKMIEAYLNLNDMPYLKRIYSVFAYRLFKQGWIRNIGLLLWLLKLRRMDK